MRRVEKCFRRKDGILTWMLVNYVLMKASEKEHALYIYLVLKEHYSFQIIHFITILAKQNTFNSFSSF